MKSFFPHLIDICRSKERPCPIASWTIWVDSDRMIFHLVCVFCLACSLVIIAKRHLTLFTYFQTFLSPCVTLDLHLNDVNEWHMAVCPYHTREYILFGNVSEYDHFMLWHWQGTCSVDRWHVGCRMSGDAPLFDARLSFAPLEITWVLSRWTTKAHHQNT